MIVSDIILRVRSTFGDAAAVQVQDADILRWINDAQIEIVKNNDQALQTTAFVNLVVNQATYTLPTDLLLLRSLRYQFPNMTSYSNLKYLNMQEFDDSIDGWDGTTYSASNPIYFTMYEGKAVLFPTPNQSATNGLKVLYNRQPTTVTLTSDPLALPILYHNTVVQYCMWQASLLDESLDAATLYRADFQSSMNGMSNNETKDPSATYPTITVLEFDQ